MANPLQTIQAAFATERRPEHFTDPTHCEECADHDRTLLLYRRQNLPLKLIHNRAWDPICFVTPEAFRYLFPRLCELAYGTDADYYLDQFIFHLEYNLESLHAQEYPQVLAVLEEISAQNEKQIKRHGDKRDLRRLCEKLKKGKPVESHDSSPGENAGKLAKSFMDVMQTPISLKSEASGDKASGSGACKFAKTFMNVMQTPISLKSDKSGGDKSASEKPAKKKKKSKKEEE